MILTSVVAVASQPAEAQTEAFTVHAEILSPTAVTISWDPVELPDGEPVLYYFVYRPDGAGFSPGTSPHAHTNLTPGQTYTLKVLAYGFSASREGAVTLTMPEGPEPPPPPAPLPPTISITSRTSTRVYYRFEHNNGPMGVAATGFEMRMSPGGYTASHATQPPLDSSYLIIGLTPATNYLLEIRALSANGPSPWASVAFNTLAPPPGTPVLTHVVPDENGVFVRWDPPASNGSTITGYDIIINEVETNTRASTSWRDASAGGIGGLRPGINYRLFVRATSTSGPGPFVSADFRTLGGDPPPPPDPPVEPDPEPNCRQAPVNPAFETTDPVRASIYRLYCAYFLRYPDLGGFAFWHTTHTAGGWEMIRISNYFAVSPEFVATYGSLDDRAFVDLIYGNIMERTSEPGGRDFWIAELASKRWTRGGVMYFFSQSDEFRTKTGTS